MKRIPLPYYIKETGDHFELTETFLKNSCVIDPADTTLRYAGIPLTKVDDRLMATSKEELHTFVIGDSGSGKTRRVILPTIMMLSQTGESMVISDPKGELFRTTADTLKKRGYTVIALNFRHPSHSCRWNPLTYIEKLYRSGDRDKQDRAMLALKDFLDIIKKDVESTDDRFWEQMATSTFLGAAQLLLENNEEEGVLTFENVAAVVQEINQKCSRSSSFGDKLLSKLDAHSPLARNLAGLLTAPEKTRTSIISVFEGMLYNYASQESLMDLFSCSEIKVEEIGRKPTAVFFILPDDSAALYPVATILVKQIYSTLVDLADKQPSGLLENKVTFLLDEFANFAPIPAIDSMLTAARSRGIRFVLVCQSMEQLNAKYGTNGAETLMANCRVWIYMSCRNLPFLERLSRMSGQYISYETGRSHPLLSIAELQHLQMGQVLVLNNRCCPYMGWLPDFSEYNFGIGTPQKSLLEPNTKQVQRVQITFQDLERVLDERREAALLNKRIEQSQSIRSSIAKKQQAETSPLDERLSALLGIVPPAPPSDSIPPLPTPPASIVVPLDDSTDENPSSDSGSPSSAKTSPIASTDDTADEDSKKSLPEMPADPDDELDDELLFELSMNDPDFDDELPFGEDDEEEPPLDPSAGEMPSPPTSEPLGLDDATDDQPAPQETAPPADADQPAQNISVPQEIFIDIETGEMTSVPQKAPDAPPNSDDDADSEAPPKKHFESLAEQILKKIRRKKNPNDDSSTS